MCYYWQNCLETSLHGLLQNIAKPLFRRQKIWQSIIMCFISFRSGVPKLGYICLSEGVPLRLAIEGKKYVLFISNYLYI